SKKLRLRVEREVANLTAQNPDAKEPVPLELATTSASGLDPHLSPKAALWQVPRIAKARKVAADRVRAIVENQIEAPDLGLFGVETVNVLRLNIALDKSFGRPEGTRTATSTASTRSSTTSASQSP